MATNGIRKAIPAEVFTTAPVIGAWLCEGINTPDIPKAAAERIIAPTLCGSVSSSRITREVSLFGVSSGYEVGEVHEHVVRIDYGDDPLV